MSLDIDVFGTVTVAMCVFFLGGAIVQRFKPLRDFGIPQSVVGGLIGAIVLFLVFISLDIEVKFSLDRRDTFLIYFFTVIGLQSNMRSIWANRNLLLTIIALILIFIVVQNIAGMAIASAFDYHPKLGIVTGSMALAGRTGTTVAWAPLFEERFGLENVSRLGVGASMLGIIAAACLGGTVARALIRHHRLPVPGQGAGLHVGISRDGASPQLDYRAFLAALLHIHVAILLGQGLHIGLSAAGIALPLYTSCLAAGIVLGNLITYLSPALVSPESDQGLSLIADVSLGLFYTMTVMSTSLWTIQQGMLTFLIIVVVIQALVALVFAWFVVFRWMGRDYDAAVISAGFFGLSLGSTATTMAIITAVSQHYGRSLKAFTVVPLACGFFSDILNSLAIHFFAGL